jgi:hypothetical protein
VLFIATNFFRPNQEAIDYLLNILIKIHTAKLHGISRTPVLLKEYENAVRAFFGYATYIDDSLFGAFWKGKHSNA